MSAVTVHRDLQVLSEEGLLQRVRNLRAARQPAIVVVAALDRLGRRLLERVRCREELKMLGVVTHDDSDFRLVARADVPIGHKVALKPLKAGDTVIKYGEDIGRMVADAEQGGHVHVHNLKTKRW